ncbi:UNKNOWN [Stylonychia lemnae]|uniref:Uncharacterized protein n=1 Tax=Stylonychia lemnae TaxID=5949 RepID=A0A078B1V9_STYLE|nr:UNKNOWN [Stylonychia lemnae]|eukprot:CDW87308.1 UNKNOWN [Stylonychia lemnae]
MNSNSRPPQKPGSALQQHFQQSPYRNQNIISSGPSGNMRIGQSMINEGRQFQQPTAMQLQFQQYDEILENSPYNFFHGINPKRLMRGKSIMNKCNLIRFLSCNFCNNIIVQGRECPSCESNFCAPCVKRWEASDSAKLYQTPCKCPDVESLKTLSKLKAEYLQQIRFNCQNRNCLYQLTYDELLRGTHELEECNYIRVMCEGCGVRIFKQEQLKHESVECEVPKTKQNMTLFQMRDELSTKMRQAIIQEETPLREGVSISVYTAKKKLKIERTISAIRSKTLMLSSSQPEQRSQDRQLYKEFVVIHLSDSEEKTTQKVKKPKVNVKKINTLNMIPSEEIKKIQQDFNNNMIKQSQSVLEIASKQPNQQILRTNKPPYVNNSRDQDDDDDDNELDMENSEESSEDDDEDSEDEDYTVRGNHPKRKIKKDYILNNSKINIQNPIKKKAQGDQGWDHDSLENSELSDRSYIKNQDPRLNLSAKASIQVTGKSLQPMKSNFISTNNLQLQQQQLQQTQNSQSDRGSIIAFDLESGDLIEEITQSYKVECDTSHHPKSRINEHSKSTKNSQKKVQDKNLSRNITPN